MQITLSLSLSLSLFLLLFSSFSLTIQCFGPAAAPDSGDGVGISSDRISDPPALPPASEIIGEGTSSKGASALAPVPVAYEEGKESGETPAASSLSDETASTTVKWCAVRDEFEDCQYYLSLLMQIDGYTWTCVQRETTQQCMDSVKKGEADLVTLEPGLAYIAFLNFSMKAIANEVYCDHVESYDAVAVVNRKACEKGSTSLMDFKGQRSCHGGYSTATGWNYPIHHLNRLLDGKKLSDQEMVTEFFSEICAPSEIEGMGVCSGCGNENGSCHSNSLYSGHSGAFRCLIEEAGDIAFVKGDTALLYSKDGPYNQTWSTKSFSDFMYLCPDGGCREINGYPGPCSFGSVPANAIMSRNSISRKKRSVILQTLLNATWVDALYTGKNGAGHLLSSRVQGLSVIKKLTRSYLGTSASISQSIQNSDTKKVQTVPSTVYSVPDVTPSSSARARHPWIFSIISTLLGLILQAFSP